MIAAVLSSLLLTAAPVAEGPLHVQIADSLSCPSAAQLLEALDQQLGPGRAVLGGDGRGVALLEVFSAEQGANPIGSYFTVRLTSTSAHLTAEQMLDAHRGSCVELARAVALLTQSWLRDMPSEKDLVGLTPPPEPVPPSAPPSAVVRTAPRPAERPTSPPRFSLSGGVGGVVSTTSGFGADATFEVALPARFGAGLRVSYLPPLSGSGSVSGPNPLNGTVTVNRLSGALLVTYLFLPPKSETSLSLGAVAGGLILFDWAQSSGDLIQPSAKTHWQLGGLLGLRLFQPISRSFFFYGEADWQLVPHPLTFSVCDIPLNNEETCPPSSNIILVTQQAWWVSLSVGLGWRFL
jgi:hypothetical protein